MFPLKTFLRFISNMNFFPNTHLQAVTASSYNSKMNKWIKSMPEHKNNLSYIFLHPYFSMSNLRKFLVENNIDTAQTIHSYIRAVISAAEHNPKHFTDVDTDTFNNTLKKWKDMRQVYHEYANSYRLQQKPSPTQAKKGGSSLKLEDLIKARDELPDGSIDKLLLSFYTYIPPVRSDYYATQILNFGEIPTYPNYIFHSAQKSHMKITDFKTAKLYKSIEYELPPELHRQLSLSLAESPRKFLFQNKDGQVYSRNRFSAWASLRLTRLFRKEFTLTFFRHIFISSLDFNSSAEVLFDISRKMGHSITQQMLYRWKEHGEAELDEDASE